jgi:hypothetical protein
MSGLGLAQQAMSRAMAGAGAGLNRQPTQQTGLTEEQKIYKSILDKAANDPEADPKQVAALINAAGQAGLPTGPYQVLSGNPSPQQQQAQYVNSLISANLAGASSSQVANPFARPQGGPPGASGAITPPPEMKRKSQAIQALDEIFTPEHVARVVAKKYGGVDVGQHELTDPSWFSDFAVMRRQGLTAMQAKESLAMKYGYIPQQASQLKDLPLAERQAITESAVWKMVNDPEFDKQVRTRFPNADPLIAKMGLALTYVAGDENMPIPDSLRPILERFAGLSDSMKQYERTQAALDEAATTGARIGAEYANRDKSAATAAASTYSTKKAGIQAERDMTEGALITPADRTKYGVSARFKTVKELTDAGYRFPSQSDQKMYQELMGARAFLESSEDLMFGENGVFNGINTDLISRKAAQAKLLADVAAGNKRGRNYEIYKDQLTTIARRLVNVAGERGSRFSDQDIAGIMMSAPETGGLVAPIDSTEAAKQKWELIMTRLGKLIDDSFEGVYIRPGVENENQNGLIEPGNIDLNNRPVVKNANGSISTVSSMSIEADGKEYLIPTISKTGEKWTPEQAIANFRKTGEHLGAFKDVQSATKYAKELHEQQAKQYGKPKIELTKDKLYRDAQGNEAYYRGTDEKGNPIWEMKTSNPSK